jgi:multidrug efflux pump subunit AcrA (membrane-fusion protein)
MDFTPRTMHLYTTRTIIISCLSFVLCACTLTNNPAAQRGTPTVDEALDGITISVEGRVMPIQQIDLAFVVSGQVASILVDVGDEVAVDQALMSLNDAALQANVRQQQAWLDAAQAQYDARSSGTTSAQERVLLAEIDRAAAALDLADSALREATLRAPFNGTVLEVSIAAGEAVMPGQRTLVLADTNGWIIETLDLQEQDAARVILGHRAQVDIPAVETVLDGTVTDLALSATAYQGSVTYRATIDLDAEMGEGLRSGMTAYVTIDLYSPLRPANLASTLTPTNTTDDSASPSSPTPMITTGETIYTVRSGDTLSGIARQYNVTVNDIMRANNLSDRNLIHQGLELVIPASQDSGG